MVGACTGSLVWLPVDVIIDISSVVYRTARLLILFPLAGHLEGCTAALLSGQAASFSPNLSLVLVGPPPLPKIAWLIV